MARQRRLPGPRDICAILGPVEEGLRPVGVVVTGNIDGPTDRVAVVVPLPGCLRDVPPSRCDDTVLKEAVGIELVVADVLEGVTVKVLSAGFRGYFNRSAGVLAQVRAVVGSRDA